ncbi:MAG: serine proteinase [uncultured archaeon A07HR60]|nr:MAG: serine proteinase [uncultured archaeon A07HR60]
MDRTRRGVLSAVGIAAVAGCTSLAAQQSEDDGQTNASDDQSTDSESGEPAQSWSELYNMVAPSVARVRTYNGGPAGQGTAFQYDEDHLVTNNHVLQVRSELGTETATTVRVQYADGEWEECDIVGTDPFSDLAVLKVSAASSGEPLTMLESVPEIGTEVMVVGAPLGLEGSASQGIVSGRNRTIPGPGGFTIPDAVQTDAALNPGNSGGPIVTRSGRVAAVATATRGENLGFGVSTRLVKRVIPELIATGSYEHSYLGVRVRPVDPLVARANDLPETRGVYVSAVRDDGPSSGVLEGSTDSRLVEGADIPVGGDTIVGLAGNSIGANPDLSRVLSLMTRPGDTVAVTIVRDGSQQTVELTLGARPTPE